MKLFNRAAAASPTPYVVPPTTKFDGNDGSWSTFYINAGYPTGQNFRVLISTASSLTWLIDPLGCTNNDPSNCPDLRGVEGYAGAKSQGYNPTASSNSSRIGLYGLKLDGGTSGTDFSTLYGSQYAGINASFFEDVIGLGQSSAASLQLVEVLASVPSKEIFLGEFGLGIIPNNFGSGDLASFLSLLPNCSMPIPSLSYGYTAGASYRPGNYYGNLVLGGYDASRFTSPSHSYNIMSSSSAGPFSTYVQSIIVSSGSNTQSATLDDQDFSHAFTAQIDSTFPYLWLPDAVVNRFVEIFGLTYDQSTDLYTINVTQRIKNLNDGPTISIKMAETASSPNVTVINLPYAAFDLNASWPIYNSTTPYFPIRRSPSSTYILGRTLLQEAYLTVDYGRQNWSLGQAKFPPTMPPQNVVPILSPTTVTSSNKKGSPSLGAGVFAGIIVAAVVVALVIILGIFFFLRRSKKRRDSSATPFAEADVATVDPNKYFQAGVSPTSPLRRAYRGSMRSNESDMFSELPSTAGDGPLSPANVHPPEGFYNVVSTRNRRISELASPERDVKEWLEGKSNHSRGRSDSSTELSGGDMPVVAELPAESLTPDFVSEGTPSPGPGVLDDPLSIAGGERGRNGENGTRATRTPLTVVHEVDVDVEEGNESERTSGLPLAAVQEGEKENATAATNQEQ